MSEEPDALRRRLGLKDDEYERILTTLGREPRPAELAMYGAMWSEHCSYKSSKIYLKTLPTEGPAVLVGPGQDAGAVDVGDGWAAVFKLESHSHPSAIEPYQGAATGVGGIVRDIISMGARPEELRRVRDEGLAVFRYAGPDGVADDAHNPNGALENIAGIRNAAGNVVGLMPHPEHAVDPDVGPTGGQPLFASLFARALAGAGA